MCGQQCGIDEQLPSFLNAQNHLEILKNLLAQTILPESLAQFRIDGIAYLQAFLDPLSLSWPHYCLHSYGMLEDQTSLTVTGKVCKLIITHLYLAQLCCTSYVLKLKDCFQLYPSTCYKEST